MGQITPAPRAGPRARVLVTALGSLPLLPLVLHVVHGDVILLAVLLLDLQVLRGLDGVPESNISPN